HLGTYLIVLLVIPLNHYCAKWLRWFCIQSGLIQEKQQQTKAFAVAGEARQSVKMSNNVQQQSNSLTRPLARCRKPQSIKASPSSGQTLGVLWCLLGSHLNCIPSETKPELAACTDDLPRRGVQRAAGLADGAPSRPQHSGDSLQGLELKQHCSGQSGPGICESLCFDPRDCHFENS
ncbi:hypothetical protein F4803DRAFT_574222, partial [Xylaria telfairii]